MKVDARRYAHQARFQSLWLWRHPLIPPAPHFTNQQTNAVGFGCHAQPRTGGIGLVNGH
jgi:hypothetical protein